ncbi:hypothetical protein [Yoonia sp. 2307UL14-13]|uniref:hypothetical protein n=1 Tax=Yoonia sp. 2307UL14-13 TaxID=3126506 RepID=UPI0030ECB1C8
MFRKHILAALCLLPGYIAADSAKIAQDFLTHYDDAYPAAQAIWPGFDPATIPKVVIGRKPDGSTDSLIIMDHPDPQSFGVTVDIPRPDGKPGKAFLVTAPHDNPKIAGVGHFAFNVDLHDAPTFLIASDCTDPDIPDDCAAYPDYIPYLVHEVFHRWQDDRFAGMEAFVDQTTYDLKPAAIAAILLETKALQAAITADDIALQRSFAQQFLAIRADRAARFDHIDLDAQQERIEGTAMYVELQLPINDGMAKDILRDALDLDGLNEGIKDELGFGRFYASGAAVITLAIQLGGDDVLKQITDGAAPADILAQVVGTNDRSQLISAAKAQFDPDDTLATRAGKLARIAETEPDIF